MKQFLNFFTGIFFLNRKNRKYSSATREDIVDVNFKYDKVLEQLQDYDSGKLKGKLNTSAGIKSLQDYFRNKENNTLSK